MQVRALRERRGGTIPSPPRICRPSRHSDISLQHFFHPADLHRCSGELVGGGDEPRPHWWHTVIRNARLAPMRTCESCGGELGIGGARGRLPRFCSNACKQRAYRRRQVPAELTSGSRWVRADGKRPIRTNGRPASSTDSATWATFSEVRKSSAGNGFGVMLGGGLGCYDLDHVTDQEAREFIATIPERVLYAERSVSGHGVHVFVEAPESSGWKRTIDGLNVERYTRARFIRTTLNRF